MEEVLGGLVSRSRSLIREPRFHFHFVSVATLEFYRHVVCIMRSLPYGSYADVMTFLYTASSENSFPLITRTIVHGACTVVV